MDAEVLQLRIIGELDVVLNVDGGSKGQLGVVEDGHHGRHNGILHARWQFALGCLHNVMRAAATTATGEVGLLGSHVRAHVDVGGVELKTGGFGDLCKAFLRVFLYSDFNFRIVRIGRVRSKPLFKSSFSGRKLCTRKAR